MEGGGGGAVGFAWGAGGFLFFFFSVRCCPPPPPPYRVAFSNSPRLEQLDCTPIDSECPVRRHEPQRLTERLGEEQAIKGIRVMQRQSGNRCGMGGGHRQFLKSAGLDRCGEGLGIAFDLTELRLDGNFPDRGGGHIHCLRRTR